MRDIYQDMMIPHRARRERGRSGKKKKSRSPRVIRPNLDIAQVYSGESKAGKPSLLTR